MGVIDSQLTPSYVDRVLRMDGAALQPTGNFRPLSWFISNTERSFPTIGGDGLQIGLASGFALTRATIIIEFTKASDTVQ